MSDSADTKSGAATPRSLESRSDQLASEKASGDASSAAAAHELGRVASFARRSEGPATVEDVAETKRIIRKLDWRVLPICSLLYLFSFLDRSNIGNAKVAGMNKSLHLSVSEYNAAVSIFFALYSTLEVPSNIALKRLGPKLWLPIIVCAWGLVMLLHGFVQSGTGLIIARLFLGATESGLFPGVSLLLSYLYPRSHIQLRLGLFFANATVAGAFGGLIAYGLSYAHDGSFASWRFIFIVEGGATILAGVLGWFLLINGFEDAKFLAEGEKEYMQDRINYDGTDTPLDQSFKWKYVRQGLRDVKTWLALITYIGIYAPVYSISLQLPSILNTALGYNAIQSQLMTVPVYVVAAVVVVIWSFLADRLQNRTIFLLLGSTLSAVGWIIGLATDNPRAGFAGVFLSAAGSYGAFPSIVALTSQNTAGQTKRGVAFGILVGLGGLCGLIAPNIFLADELHRNYPTAHGVNLGLNGLAFLGALINAAYLAHCNRRKQRLIDIGEAAKLTVQELIELGDENPYFKYRF